MSRRSTICDDTSATYMTCLLDRYLEVSMSYLQDHCVGSLGRDSTNQPLSQGSRTEDGLNGKDRNMAGMFKLVETYQFVR